MGRVLWSISHTAAASAAAARAACAASDAVRKLAFDDDVGVDAGLKCCGPRCTDNAGDRGVVYDTGAGIGAGAGARDCSLGTLNSHWKKLLVAKMARKKYFTTPNASAVINCAGVSLFLLAEPLAILGPGALRAPPEGYDMALTDLHPSRYVAPADLV